MKCLLLFLALTLTACHADQITIFYGGSPTTSFAVKASASGGLSAGPAFSFLATDITTNVSVPLDGFLNVSTGAATAYTIMPTLLLASFSAGGGNSVSLIDSVTMLPLLQGITNNDSTLVGTLDGGTGAFLSGFEVTFLSSQFLADFALSSIDPRGSLSITFGHDKLSASDLSSTGGGGTITLVGTPLSAVPEVSTAGLCVTGLLLCGGGLKLRHLLR